MNLRKGYNCRDENEFDTIHHNLKTSECPHCRKTGFLILHGYLKGYDSKTYTNKDETRARRIFCSNRNRRQGCGKTISIFINTVIKGFTLSTRSLWQYLNNIREGLNKFQAFTQLNLPYATTTVYRIYKRASLRQTFIRNLLLKHHPSPEDIPASGPLIHTIEHIRRAFNTSDDPLAALQTFFQEPIL